MSSKLEVRIYQGHDLKIRYPMCPSGLSVSVTLGENTQSVEAAAKSSTAEFNQALYFTNANLTGSLKVRVTDRTVQGSDLFVIGQVEIPLSLVTATPTGTEVKHLFGLDNAGGEVTLGLIPTHAAVEAEEHKLEKSHTIGPYGLSNKKKSDKAVIGYAPEDIQRIFPHLARGTFGVVFRGRAKGIPSYVVVKDMEIQNQGSISEWQKEIDIMARTKSPYVAEVYGWSSMQNQLTIVMEFMCHGDLFGILHKKQDKHPLSLIIRMRMGRHCALGLQVLHQAKIIHRDVKTMNYLVNENYDVKITDFGCSKMSNDNMIYNTSNVGSPLWMAPEVRIGQYSFSSDIYSLGICLFEIFERKLPEFDGQSQSTVLPPQYQSQTVVAPCLNRQANARPTIDQVIMFLDKLTKKIVSKTKTVLEPADIALMNQETDKELAQLQAHGHTADRTVVEEKNLYNILLDKKEQADLLFQKAGFDIGPGKLTAPVVIPPQIHYHADESSNSAQQSLAPNSQSIQHFSGYEKSHETLNVPKTIINKLRLSDSKKASTPEKPKEVKKEEKHHKGEKEGTGLDSDEEIPSSGVDPNLKEGPRVIIVGAKDLKSADSNGLSDPYAKIYCNGRQSKTKTIKKTLNPTWDHVIGIKGLSKVTLQVTLWDWDRIGTDDYLGYCETTFEVGTKDQDFWLDVVPGSRKKEKNISGQVHILVKLT